MSNLQFICGSAGSGKSTWLFDEVIKKSGREPERNFLFIVPEQFTMATQKDLVSRFPRNSIMNIDVLSFQRLAFRVFDDLGKSDFEVLGETGKNLVIRKVAQQHAEELTYLGSNLRRMGYVSEIKSLLSEFMQYRVTPEVLADFLEKEEEDTAFSRKLKDILIIYKSFREYLKGTYITAEEILELLISVADDSELLRDSVIILDGFTGFTPIQNALLLKIFPLVSEIRVAVTMDSRGDVLKEPELTDLFYMSEKMVHALLRIAEETGTEVLPPVRLGDGSHARFLNADCINYMEQNLFRTRAGQYPERKDIIQARDGESCRVDRLGEAKEKQRQDSPSSVPAEYLRESEQIRIAILKDPREELSYAVSEIRRMVREEGMRYRDFAIVTGDLSTYANYAAEIFAKYDVPGFVDQNRAILFHPMTEMLRGLFGILSGDWQTESVFHYLRSGLSGISREETDRLENYVLSKGIRGSSWRKRWAVLPKRGTEEDLLELNRLREKLLDEISPLEAAFSGEEGTAAGECRALYEFLLAHGIGDRLLEEAERKENEGDYEKARGYEQIYGIVIGLIDQIAFLLGEEKLTAEEFSEILDAGFEAADFGLLPPGYDRVTLGDIERTRLPEIKGLFFLGVNDGIIPGNVAGAGIISELERESFEEAGIALAPSPKERTFIQRFYLYMNLTKPSERLILTYAKTDASGNAVHASYLIGEIQKLFPGLAACSPELDSYAFETAESAKEVYLSHLPELVSGSADESIRQLHAWYQKRPEYASFTEKMLDAAFMMHKPERITRETAKALYGMILSNSVTRLERYAECAFSHFIRYGLGLTERDVHELGAPDLGNLYHSALEIYGKKLSEEGLSWVSAGKEDADRIVTEALSEAVLRSEHGEFFADAKGRFDQKRMERILRRSVSVLSDQLRAGFFTPEAYEVRFGYEDALSGTQFSLGEGEKMFLSGQIDRLDTYTDGDDLYVKVIDYKSGMTSFDLLAVYEGLQLQLVVYLGAADELMAKKHPGKKVHPGGIFYYHLDDPIIVSEEELTEEEVDNEIMRELRPDGPFNREDKAVFALDRGLSDHENTDPSMVLRAKRKKDGDFDSRTRAFSEEDFSLLRGYVRKKILHYGREIQSGDILVQPYERKNIDACERCRYRGICGYDEKVPGYAHRSIAERDDVEIFEKMREEFNGNSMD